MSAPNHDESQTNKAEQPIPANRAGSNFKSPPPYPKSGINEEAATRKLYTLGGAAGASTVAAVCARCALGQSWVSDSSTVLALATTVTALVCTCLFDSRDRRDKEDRWSKYQEMLGEWEGKRQSTR